MENNFIQMATATGLTVAHPANTIFQYILDSLELYFTNSSINIYRLNFYRYPKEKVERCQIMAA